MRFDLLCAELSDSLESGVSCNVQLAVSNVQLELE